MSPMLHIHRPTGERAGRVASAVTLVSPMYDIGALASFGAKARRRDSARVPLGMCPASAHAEAPGATDSMRDLLGTLYKPSIALAGMLLLVLGLVMLFLPAPGALVIL